MSNIKITCLLIISFLLFSNCKTAEIKPEPTKQTTQAKQNPSENDEAKAIRLAEEFIKRNGYTEAPAEKDKIKFESSEISEDVEKILQSRHNTLEPKAYGISYHTKSGKGWTVVFKYNEEYMKTVTEMDLKDRGKALTMDENFENLEMQYKDFFLEYAEKKLR